MRGGEWVTRAVGSSVTGNAGVVRDIGGWCTFDGGRFRPELIYRLAGSLLEPADLDRLTALRLGLVIDMRGEAEDRSLLAAWARSAGVRYQHIAVPVAAPREMAAMLQTATTVEAGVAMLRQSYELILDDFGSPLAEAVEAIADSLPAAFGCSLGKDRTGVLAALLQELAEVPVADIATGYAESAPEPDRLHHLVARFKSRAEVDLDSPGIAVLATAPRIVMEHTLAYLIQQWGGALEYLVAHGLARSTGERLRARLVTTG